MDRREEPSDGALGRTALTARPSTNAQELGKHEARPDDNLAGSEIEARRGLSIERRRIRSNAR